MTMSDKLYSEMVLDEQRRQQLSRFHGTSRHHLTERPLVAEIMYCAFNHKHPYKTH